MTAADQHAPARAIVFDFNGSLSDDEPVLEQVYAELFAAHGRPLSTAEYRDHLAGLSEEAIVHGWLGDRPDLGELVQWRIDRYRELVTDGSTVHEHVRAAVRAAAARVPVAIVSGASAAEIHPVIAAAGIADEFATVITADDVTAGKPDPEGYLLALDRLRGVVADLAAAEVVVLEDAEVGVASARAAGMRCLGVLGTLPAHRLAAAEELVDRIDVGLIDRLLAG
jgi:beta-phosphoglucomutase